MIMWKPVKMCVPLGLAILMMACGQESDVPVVPADSLVFQESTSEERKRYIPAFEDKNDNGRFDGLDTILYLNGNVIKSKHSIVFPRYKKVDLRTSSKLVVRSDKRVTIERDILCKDTTGST